MATLKLTHYGEPMFLDLARGTGKLTSRSGYSSGDSRHGHCRATPARVEDRAAAAAQAGGQVQADRPGRQPAVRVRPWPGEAGGADAGSRQGGHEGDA